MSNYTLGLVSVSFRDSSPVQILSAVKKNGLSCIEWGSDIHAPKDDVHALGEIARLQKEVGIVCCSYGTYFRLGVTPISELEGYIRAAEILGTNMLRLWCGEKASQEYSVEDKEKLFVECSAAAEIARSNGVKLCMECHNGTFTDRRDSAEELMNAIHSNAFRMYWQPNQYRTKEENLEYARALAGYTEHIHVFNWKGEKKLLLEEGRDIWKEYLEVFGEGKTLLLEFMPDDNIESLSSETNALRKIAGVNG